MKLCILRGGLLLAAAALIPACNGSGNAAGGGGPPASSPTATLATPVGLQTGNVVLTYRIADDESDPCSVAVAYSLDGGATFVPASAGPGGDGVAGLSSSPGLGTVHTFVWDSVANNVGLTAVSSAEIRIVPSDAVAGTSGTTPPFNVVNRLFTPPTATLTTPVGTQSGLVPLSYKLIDAESDPCSIVAAFSLDGGATFNPATAGVGGDGVLALASSTGAGTAHTFVWNSVADGVAAGLSPASVRFRVSPFDPSTGTAGTTGAFSVSNRPFTPPSATIATPAGTQSSLVTLSYKLIDAESDSCSIVAAYSLDGGTTFNPATAGAGGDGVVALASSTGAGTSHTFVWNSLVDGVATGLIPAGVKFRVTPSDPSAGTAATTGAFTVSNRPFTPPGATITTPAGTQSGQITLSYKLIDAESDPCSIVAAYSLDGGTTFNPATAGAGGDGLSSLTSSTGAGTAHTFVWNSVADGVATGLTPASVKFRVTPFDPSAGTAATTGTFSVSNRPFTTPTASVTTPAGLQSGNILISYTLTDAENDPCTIVAQFSLDGGATFSPATQGTGGNGVAGLTSSPGGTAHTFGWNSGADGVATGLTPASVKFRVTPSDPSAGTAGTSGTFSVSNRPFTPPSASITAPGGISSGNIAVTFTLTDAESDPCSVLVEFSLNGGGSYATATPGPGSGALTGLSASPGGSAHGFVWNSFVDGAALAVGNAAVRLRVTPNDGSAGVPGATANFNVDNSGLSSGSSIGGGFPVTIDGTLKADAARSIATDGAALFVLGFDNLDLNVVPQSDLSWRVEKRDARTGAAVTAFGAAGSLVFNPGPGFDLPVKVLVDGASIFVVGLRESAAGSGSFLVEVRKFDATSGAPVAGFGAAGILTGPAGAVGDGIPLVWTAAVDGAALYMAGPEPTSPTVSHWRVEKRDKTTGAAIGGFSAVSVSSGSIDGCFGMTLDATSMWLVGVEQADGGLSSNSRIRLEKRQLSTGALVSGFGSGGSLTIDPGPGDDLAEDCVSDGIALYVYSRVETGFSTGVFSPRLDKLDLTTGAVLGTLSATGAVDPSGELPARHLAIGGGALYVACVDNSTDPRWRIEKRLTSDFSLVASFGTAGIRTINPSGGDDRPLDVLFLGGVLYVVGSDASTGGGRWRIEGLWR